MKRLAVVIDSTGAERGGGRFVSTTRRMQREARNTGRAIDAMNARTVSLGRSLRQLAAFGATVFAFGGAAASIRGLINNIAEFESTLALTAAVAGVDRTSAAFDALNAKARELGATTRFSAKEAGDALLFLARAGFTVDEAIGSVASTLNLAAAGGLALGEAADIASNVGSTFAEQYGGAVNATAKATDVLVAASNRANTNVAQLAEAMKFGGPTAAAFGVSLEEAAAAAGQLGNFGIQASLAGTNLRGILSGLVDVTDKGGRALSRMGLEVDDLNPATNSLADIFTKLRDNGFGAVEALELFGRRNAGAALILAKSADAVRELTGELENAEGEAQRIADAMNDTLIGAFLSLKSIIQEIGLQIGEAGFGGALRATVDTMTGALRILAGITVEGEEASRASMRLAETTRVLAGAMGTLVAIKLAGWFALATKAALAFTAALATNPIGLASVALSTLVGALIAFRNETIKIGGEPMRVIDILIASWEHVREAVGVAFRTIGEVVPTIMERVGEAARLAFNGILDAAQTMLNLLAPGFGDTFNNIIEGIIKPFAQNARAVLTGIANLVRYLIDELLTVTRAVANVDFTNRTTFVASLAQSAGILAGGFSGFGEDAAAAFQQGFADGINGESMFDQLLSIQGEASAAWGEILRSAGATITDEELERLFFPGSAAESILDRARELYRQRNELIEQGSASNVDAIRDTEAAIREEMLKLQQLADAEGESGVLDKLLGDPDALAQRTSALSSTITSGLSSIIFSADNASEGFRRLGESIAQLAVQKLFLDQISQALDGLFGGGGTASGTNGGLFGFLGGLFSAKGNVFSGGRVQAFASGGLIDQTAIFPLQNGMVGVAGEAGTEYAAPIVRDHRGRTAVAAVGGGTTVHMGGITVVANNPAEFKQGMTSVTNDVKRMLRNRG